MLKPELSDLKGIFSYQN